MTLQDYIGGLGENIAFEHLARLDLETSGARFWLHHLGEKCETLDYLVELVGVGGSVPFFFVQVKTTTKAFTTTQTPPRLRVEVSETDLRRLLSFPAPTYIVGVHYPERRAFIISVHEGMTESIPSITTAHELTFATLKRLWEEVRDFWAARDMKRTASAFLNGGSA